MLLIGKLCYWNETDNSKPDFIIASKEKLVRTRRQKKSRYLQDLAGNAIVQGKFYNDTTNLHYAIGAPKVSFESITVSSSGKYDNAVKGQANSTLWTCKKLFFPFEYILKKHSSLALDFQ